MSIVNCFHGNYYLLQVGDNYASPFVVIHPEQKLTAQDKTFTVEMDINVGSTDSVKIYRTNSASFATWTSVSTSGKGGEGERPSQLKRNESEWEMDIDVGSTDSVKIYRTAA